MEAKHTPGPWFYRRRKVREWDSDSEEILSIQTSAIGFEDDQSICGIHALDDRSMADARLISAAPELLEALKLIRDYIVTMKQAGHEYSVAIDAAIAKATGVQQ